MRIDGNLCFWILIDTFFLSKNIQGKCLTIINFNKIERFTINSMLLATIQRKYYYLICGTIENINFFTRSTMIRYVVQFSI